MGTDIHQSVREAQVPLRKAVQRLSEALRDPLLESEMPLEASYAMESAVKDIRAALAALDAALPAAGPSAKLDPHGPTRRQGQFLAYIREYMLRNYDGVSPTHAVLQRFFDLTPPSVNSMLIRLEKRGFIRRIPHQARSVELTIDPGLIPPLERPFRG